jgi:hypothetical protein
MWMRWVPDTLQFEGADRSLRHPLDEWHLDLSGSDLAGLRKDLVTRARRPWP